MENFIRWYDEVIPPSLCDELIEAFESSDHKVTRDRPAKRNTEVSVIPDHLIDQLIKIVNPHLQSYAKDNDFMALSRYENFDIQGFAIKKYEPNTNDFHDWHTDSTGPLAFRRFLAIQCYLNTVEEGGHTEFKTPEEIRIQPLKGRLVFFPTAWTHMHRGTPPISGPKYSMNSYLLFPNNWITEYITTMDKYRINSSNNTKRI
jgi:hypothetical protein